MGATTQSICISRDATKPPVTDVLIVHPLKNELCPPEYTRIPGFLSRTTSGSKVCVALCYTKATTRPYEKEYAILLM